MKEIKASFLFLFIITSFISFAQKSLDSLSFYSNMVENPKSDSDLVKSYVFFDNLYQENHKARKTSNIVYALLHKSSIEFKQGFHQESEQSAIKALKLADRSNNTAYLKKLKTSLYNHLGILYREQKNFKQSKELYNKSLLFSDNLKDSIKIYNNIANVFKEENRLSESKEILVKALKKASKLENKIIKALVLDNLGVVKSKINSLHGEDEILSALKIREDESSQIGLYISYIHLADFYKDNRDEKKSREYILKSLLIAKKINSVSYERRSLGLLTELSDDRYTKQYKKLNDSIVESRERSLSKFALLKYNTTKQEEISKENQLKAEKAEKETLKYQSLGFVIFLLSVAGYFIYREKNKKKIVERVIETEGKISKTVHDVIANDVYHVMLKLQSDESKQDDILDDLEKVYERARDISRDNYIITEEMNFQEILQDLFSSYQNKDVIIITKQLQKINWTKFTIQKKNMLYRVLKELMTNMKKYSQANLVTIAFEQKNKIHINYRDNGVGGILSKKNGLLNAENRIKSVNGKITFISEPEKGFGIKIIV